ncbi:MAG: 30S ribosomal protein S12 methylthiotransferase RimO [Magnetococcales bacterium]|nr:30S ribosomal protein S12 methylthiotransferase RimO [Magnetococcales bacterium]
MAEEGSGKRVGVISLGCPKNLVDTEKMLGRFLQQGYRLTADPEAADLLVVNTCGFKADAEAESREAIAAMGEIKARHPGKRLVVTGCLSQRYGAALAQELPEIDVLVGSAQYERLIPLIEANQRTGEAAWEVEPLSSGVAAAGEEGDRVLTTPSHTAYVKIAEGCNNPCAFCIIPQLRGRFRSRTPAEIEAEVIQLSRQGVVEINLVSQDTTLYGRDLEPRFSLAALLRRLARLEGIRWIRALYLYPTLITPELLAVMGSEEKVLPYLDIPLQHSHSAVLARMKRVERAEGIVRLLQQIRQQLPEAVVRTTFIVGFPGETKKEFRHLYRLVAQGWFDHVGVFTYSDEQGTAACLLPDKVSAKKARRRQQALMLLQQRISRKKLKQQLGRTLPVLVDGVSEAHEGLMVGRTAGQAPEVDGLVYINAGQPRPGTIVPVTITESHEYDLVGQVATI